MLCTYCAWYISVSPCYPVLSFSIALCALLLLRPGRGAEYYDQFAYLCVCLSVCSRAYLWNRWTDFHEIRCADSLWPWLGHPLAALRYVMYLRFMDDVTFGHSGPYGDAWKAESQPTSASGVAIPRRSLMSMNACQCLLPCGEIKLMHIMTDTRRRFRFKSHNTPVDNCLSLTEFRIAAVAGVSWRPLAARRTLLRTFPSFCCLWYDVDSSLLCSIRSRRFPSFISLSVIDVNK